jgi:hypothetical protein
MSLVLRSSEVWDMKNLLVLKCLRTVQVLTRIGDNP